MEFTKDFARHFPSTEDLIRAVGLQTRHSLASDIVSAVTLFGAGLLVGAGMALLFAPSSGRELREEIGERAAELRHRGAATLEPAGTEGGSRPG